MSLIELAKVSKWYRGAGLPAAALNDVDLRVAEGEMLAIMGPSGSGKTTLLTVLGAMNPPSAGRVIVDEIDVYALSSERRADFRHEYLGFVFQQQYLVPYLTALENAMLPLAISSHSQKARVALAQAALDRVGLGGKADRLPGQLSGGEQERVAIARAVVNQPPIILADEPTGCLDTETGREVMELLRSLNRDGLTVLVVTHNPDNIRYVDRVILLQDGRISGCQKVSTGDHRAACRDE